MTDTAIVTTTIPVQDAEAEWLSAPVVAEEPKARPQSPLAQLRGLRDASKAELHTDLRVPRYGTDEVPGTPEVFVRYKPVDNATFEQIVEKRSKEGKGWSVWANADVLAHHCVGVFACIDGDRSRKFSLAADPELTLDAAASVPWTRFDPQLAEALGRHAATTPTASHVCRALYQTDGDLIAAASSLMDWSQLSAEKLDEDFTTP